MKQEELPLFELSESDRRKAQGMQLAVGPRSEILDHAREVARRIALGRDSRTCTADDVQQVLHEEYGLTPAHLGPAAGSLFRTKEWVFTGHRVKSAQVNNHARELRVWRLESE